MVKKLQITLLLVTTIFLVSGCAGKPSQQTLETGNTAATPQKARVEQANPCAEIVTEAVHQARSTMRTVETSCQGKSIEATPRWNFDYDGAVHLIIKNGQGEISRDEVVKPDRQAQQTAQQADK